MSRLVLFGVAGVLWIVVKTIYRLYFHPLSKFPGPKLAAATSTYEAYFNIIKGGMFIWELQRLHDVYGPIIRIGPSELHIRDSNYYDEIYAPITRPREKIAEIVRAFDLDGSGFSSVGADTHRERRAPIERYFSKQSIINMEHMIWESLDKLNGHLRNAYHSHKVVSMDAAFAGLSSDIVHQYSFGLYSRCLDPEDFKGNVRDGVNAVLKMSHIANFCPVLPKIINCFPVWFLRYVSPPAAALADMREFLRSGMRDALSGKPVPKSSVIEAYSGPRMPPHLRGVERLTDDAMTLIIGGTETTSRSLCVGIFNVLSNKNIQSRLREELRTVMPTPETRPTWNQLEQLPYMRCVALETFRLSTGIASRSPRAAPLEALRYKEYVIPPKTAVGCTNHFVLTDPEIFPNPLTFDPERWVRAAEKGERLERYMVNFSKGSRMCLAPNLAHAELYLTLAILIRRFELELYKTSAKDVEFARDYGVPCPDSGFCRVNVLVKGLVDETDVN
ncbi:hypothetical protein N7492_000309 [Penicillium capsulatum]|uniref:Cytochrome P450 n=1 Tax=Penicillium capsulatum TaxID=69766 RepID=A0A9W9LYL0_9EURO|nr:hypothetical protein N7492_000309 [Penicillium capsulatum]KAJ6130627.1 hypothetical protein N7512_003407 [Penicillium capsulatum]